MVERFQASNGAIRVPVPVVRCAIYTRKSTEEGLDQAFNSLEAQREAAEAYIRSQQHQGWMVLPERYDDGGFSGSNLARPALQRLLEDIESNRVNCVVVYKVDRLSRSLLDFARLMERFDRRSVSFVAVTQQLNTTTSLGRLTLNILLSFAQFEREIIGERTRDKMTAARKKGKWVGGVPVLGYDLAAEGARLVVNEREAEQVREIFRLYTHHGSLTALVEELARRGWRTKVYRSRRGNQHGGRPFREPNLLRLLTQAVYIGKVEHNGELYAGEQEAIVDLSTWQSIQDELRARRPGASSTAHTNQCALLKGLLFCQLCNHPMAHTCAAAHGRRYRYYVCRRAHPKGLSRAVSAPVIEESVVGQLRRTFGSRGEDLGAAEMRRMLERVSYDGTTGGVSLRLAEIE